MYIIILLPDEIFKGYIKSKDIKDTDGAVEILISQLLFRFIFNNIFLLSTLKLTSKFSNPKISRTPMEQYVPKPLMRLLIF